MKELVIKIDDGIYKFIMSMDKALATTAIRPSIFNAIRNGKVLPKGHGRISDMDEAIKCIEECKGEDAVYAIALIEWACGKRTIIEADKGE